MSERSQVLKHETVRDAAPEYQANALEVAQDSVPPGYKRTAVGVIPENWEAITLGRSAQFRKGYGLTKDDLSDDGVYECIH